MQDRNNHHQLSCRLGHHFLQFQRFRFQHIRVPKMYFKISYHSIIITDGFQDIHFLYPHISS